MNPTRCPNCGQTLGIEEINLEEGVALCDDCGVLSRLGEVAMHRRPAVEVLRDPPASCRVTVWGNLITVVAPVRSLTGFAGVLAVSLFWNGIVSVFLYKGFTNLYRMFVGPLPDWAPIPGDGLDSLGETIFLCVFMIPFVVVGVLMLGAVVMYALGATTVTINGRRSTVATGIGWLAWRRSFDAAAVVGVRLGYPKLQSEDGDSRCIRLEADRVIKFGTMLREDRMEWMLVVLQKLLTTPDADHEALARELMNARPRRD